MHEPKETMEELRAVARSSRRSRHGARLRKALLLVAIPASAALTMACYAAPMVEGPHEPVGQYGIIEEAEQPSTAQDEIGETAEEYPVEPDEAATP